MIRPFRASLQTAITASVAFIVAGVSLANAGAFGLREQSAYGQGSSFAGVAAGGSLSSSFWNPATLAEATGLEVEQVFTFIVPITEVNLAGFGDQGDIGRDGFLPSGYGAYRLNDQVVLGVSVNGPFGLRTKYSAASPLRAAGVAGTSEVFSLTATPMISYQVTDWLSVGVGAQIQYLDVRLTALLAPGVALQGDDYGFGVTAGILLTPMEGTEIGIGYRSFVEHDLEGTLTGPGRVTVPGVKTPDLVSLGIRQRINDAWTAMATVEWANWSRIGTFPIVFSGVTIGTLPFEYNDSWFASLGAEYKWNDHLTVRGGIGYEWAPIDDANRSFRLPDDDRLWLSLGGSYEANERMSFDLGYSFLTTFDTDILPVAAGGPPTNGPFGGSADAIVHIFSAGFKYRFGG